MSKKQRYEKGYSDSDVNNLAYWFIDIMSKMLTQFRDNLTGYPTSIFYPDMPHAVSERGDEEGLIEWKKIIDRMIFLLQEMDEDTCSYKNKYEEEVDKAHKEFDDKYGFFGKNFEKINGIESENKEFKRAYFYYDDPEHPEWKELHYDWLLEEKNIRYYRDKCREEFFSLFSKHFWLLWS